MLSYTKNWYIDQKIKTNNNYINVGLKGDTYRFAMKLDELLNFKKSNLSSNLNISNELMW